MSSHPPSILVNGVPGNTSSTHTTTTVTSTLNPLAPIFYPGAATHATTATISANAARLRGHVLHAHTSNFNMAPDLFEAELHYLLQMVARPIARSGTHATREEFICKLATGAVALLNSLGFDHEMVIKALVYREYIARRRGKRRFGVKELLELARYVVEEDRLEEERVEALFHNVWDAN